MNAEAERWEERFRQEGYWAGTEPADFLRESLPLLPRPGCALELAMGEGRNAVFLAQHGWRVTGVELTGAGLDKTETLAREKGVKVWRGAPGTRANVPAAPCVLLLQADLETYALPRGQFDLVLCVNFLLRPLLENIPHALRKGGMLLYETYTLEQLHFSGGPRSPEFLLRPGELREAFSGMDILFYRECNAGKGMASVLARRRP